MPLTNGEVDAAVPAAGTPSRSLTNAALKELIVDIAAKGDGDGDLLAANNLDDVADAAIARTNLGLAIGTDVQAYSANLDEYAAVNPTAAGLALLDDADAAAQRATLDLEPGTDILAFAAAASQAEAEAGTEAALRTWSPLRVAQAIAALETGGGSGDVATDTIFDAAGDLPVGSGSNTAVRLPRGDALDVLQGNSGGTDIEWGATDGDGSVLRANAPVTLSGATNLVRATHGNRQIICDTAATHTVLDDTAGSWQNGDSLSFDNTSAGNVVIAADSTGTTNTVTAAPGHTLTIPAGFSAWLQRTGANAWIGGALIVKRVICIDVSGDESTALTTGTNKRKFRMPYAMTGVTVKASVTTAPTGAAIIVDINEAGTSIMTTNKLSIDATELTSATAATPAGVTDASLADDAEISIDVDQVGSTVAGAGLKVYIIGNAAS